MLYAVRLALRRVRTQLGDLHFAEQGIQPRGVAGRQHLRGGCGPEGKDRALAQINETGEIGPFAIEALIAAYDEGAEWLDALNEYLHDNYRFLREYFDRNLPQYPVLPLGGIWCGWGPRRRGIG